MAVSPQLTLGLLSRVCISLLGFGEGLPKGRGRAWTSAPMSYFARLPWKYTLHGTCVLQTILDFFFSFFKEKAVGV